jgi:hypothetical protein
VAQVLAVYGLVYTLAFNVGDIYKATGRPGVLNVFALIRLAMLVPLLLALVPRGIVAVAFGLIAVELLMTVLQLVVAGRLMKVGLLDVLGEFGPAVAAGAALVLATVGARALLPDDGSLVVRLVVSVAVGAAAYTATLFVVSRETVDRVLSLLLGARGVQAAS